LIVINAGILIGNRYTARGATLRTATKEGTTTTFVVVVRTVCAFVLVDICVLIVSAPATTTRANYASENRRDDGDDSSD
jgi:hypothetical protein